MAKLPSSLVEAFRSTADKDAGSIAVLLIDDGFDAQTMRVLSAWQHVELSWRQPRLKCPDDGVPTPAAWRWLTSGVEIDYDALATAAGVTRETARAKAAMLLGSHLALPDGTLSKVAQASLQAHAREALGRRPQAEKKAPAKRDEPATN